MLLCWIVSATGGMFGPPRSAFSMILILPQSEFGTFGAGRK